MTVQDTYREAVDFAARAHAGQTVPGRPCSYIVHASNVAMEMLLAFGGDAGIDKEPAIACALLHDVLEDSAVTYGELRDAFGERVAARVRALTKDGSPGKKEAMEDSIRGILVQGPEIGLVKLADRITILREPPAHRDRAKKESYLEEARHIHERLQQCSDCLARRLSQKIESYRQHL